MKLIEIKNISSENEIYIDYITSTVCNFKCSYCFPGLNDGNFKFQDDIYLVKENFDALIFFYRSVLNKDKIRVHLTGGEPTLWKHFEELCEHLKKHDVRLSVSTNGTRGVEWWKNVSTLVDDVQFSIHSEFVNLDKVIETMDYLYVETDVVVSASVFMDPDRWEDNVNIVQRMSEHPIPWFLKVMPIIKVGNSQIYKDFQKQYLDHKIRKIPNAEWLSKKINQDKIDPINKKEIYFMFDDGSSENYNYNKILNNNWHHFKGWKCNLGLDKICIDRDGTMNGSCGVNVSFLSGLNFYSNNFKTILNIQNPNAVICTADYCDCTSNIEISKKNEKL